MERNMVDMLTLVKIAKKNNINIDNVSEFALEFYYEAGMIELLRDIAELQLETVVAEETKKTKEARTNQEKYFKELLSNLKPQEAEMLREYEDLFSHEMGLSEGDNFIEGFVRGYRYSKSKIVHEM